MLECSRTCFCLLKLRAHHYISCCSFYWQSLMRSRVFIWIFITCNRCSYNPDVLVLSQPGALGRHKADRESLILKVWQCEPVFLPWNHLGTCSKPDGHIQNLLLFHCNKILSRSSPRKCPQASAIPRMSCTAAALKMHFRKGWETRAGAQSPA